MRVKAELHPRQGARLAALASYDILDTPPEEAFEEVVGLVARICEVPIALVSLVEEHRQWFKARLGLDASETPVEQSICSHAILGDGILEIEDTQTDPRSADNPLCMGDRAFRFYAGAPLITPDGLPLGSLCVLDYTPRRLTEVQRETLRVMAKQVMAQLDLRLSLRTADTLRREIDHRVKNSLQSLAAVARFEARRSKSDDAKQALERVGRRIGSVAVVHEQLYRTGTDHTVALDAYLENLARHLTEIAPDGITVSGTAPAVQIASADAAMVGVLFNETAANAFKHAFPGERVGHVRYTAEQLADGRIRFSCEDDGIGLPDEAATTRDGLGTMLGEVISLELDGMLDVTRLDPGLRITLEFTPKEPG